MKSKKLTVLVLLLAMGLLLPSQVVSAHQTLTVGDFAVEYGWVNEPAIIGQPNDVVINVTQLSAADSATPTAQAGGAAVQPASGDIDVSSFIIQVVYGGQTKILTLQPLGENTPGQFVAPMTPMLAGKYTIHLGGTIGATAFNNDVQPEEVKTADVVQFPLVDSSQAAGSSTGSPSWVGIAGLVLGALGTVLGVYSLLRKPATK
jgi:hypothetical protein